MIRIFLYLVLLAAFTGTLYFVYKTWIETLFPQKRKSKSGEQRVKRPAASSKDPVSAGGADGSAVTSGATQKAYDESWIPDHIINRPKAKRVQSGASSKAKSKGASE